MEGQITIDEWLASIPTDFTYDRRGNKKKAPDWMKYTRCENCMRWVLMPESEQPPDGWGVFGFCNEIKTRTNKGSYCCQWDERKANEV